MTRWEYLHVELASTQENPLQDQLNGYGNEGWEICFLAIVSWKKEKENDGRIIKSAYRWAVIFKRPKEEE